MNRSTGNRLLIHGLRFLLLLAGTALFAICISLNYDMNILVYRLPGMGPIVLLLYVAVRVLLFKIYNVFDEELVSSGELVFSIGLSDVVENVLAYTCFALLAFRMINPVPLIALSVCQILIGAVWCVLVKRLSPLGQRVLKTAMIYKTETDLLKLKEIKRYSHLFSVQRYIKNPNDFESILPDLEQHDVFFLAGINAQLRNNIVKYCVQTGKTAYVEPRVGDVLMASAGHVRAFSIPTVRIQKAAPAPEYLFIKRVFDIAVSLTVLLVASPAMLIVALLVKLEDGGPVLYKQLRLTKDGKEFKILKFRSMRVDAEKDGVARLSTVNDSRITKVGAFIRLCRLDELPQLINILKGDMSIVGPRPERKEIAEQYEKTIPSFGLRLQVKAGLTGYAQIYGKYNSHPYDKLLMDLMYIGRMSAYEDIKLMLATVKVLFSINSTEGIEEGSITAEGRENEDVKESA